MDIKIRMTVRKPDSDKEQRDIDRMLRHIFGQRQFRISRCEIDDLTDIGGDLEYCFNATARKDVSDDGHCTDKAKGRFIREVRLFEVEHLIKDINVIIL